MVVRTKGVKGSFCIMFAYDSLMSFASKVSLGEVTVCFVRNISDASPACSAALLTE